MQLPSTFITSISQESSHLLRGACRSNNIIHFNVDENASSIYLKKTVSIESFQALMRFVSFRYRREENVII